MLTYDNAPQRELLRNHYQNLPARLAAEHIDPRIPGLYGFRLDFCFR